MATWESYEEVAAYLLDQFASQFGLERVEGKQEIVGHRSGTTWEIDAKGVLQGNQGFLIVECRRYTTTRQSQGRLASLGYSIIDSGACGGIIVSPLGLQEGAQKVAAAENIIGVHLDENSNRYEYFLRFLNKLFIGVHDHVHTSEHVTALILRSCRTCGAGFIVKSGEFTCPSCFGKV